MLVPAGRPLRLVIVADSHSKPHSATYELVAAEQPDAILHAGDVGALAVLDELRQLAPVIAVRGNIDARDVLPDSVRIAIDAADATLCTILLTHIAMAGAKLRADAARLATRHRADLLVCGHSHMPFIGRDRGIAVFNPGAIGPRRFALPVVFGVARFSPSSIALEHVSCETGERWSPRA